MIGFLFDLDGTLVDSHQSIEVAWTALAKEMGIAAPDIFQIHGIPAVDTIMKYAPHLQGGELEKFVQRMEQAEIDTASLVRPVAGAVEIVEYLNSRGIPWTVVTSGTKPLAKARIEAIGIKLPDNAVTFDQVKRGKPDPEPFVLGATRVGVPVENCWAVEDSKGGVASAISAGCKVIGVLTSHQPSELLGASHFVTHLMQIPELLPELAGAK